MSTSTYTNIGPIYITQSAYNALVTADTVETGREYIILDSDSQVSDVKVNGTSILSSGVANIPYASTSTCGVIKVNPTYGLNSYTNGDSSYTYIEAASDTDITNKYNQCKPIVPARLDKAIKAGLGSYAGTAFSDSEKTTARSTIGAIALEEYDSTASPEDLLLYYVVE